MRITEAQLRGLIREAIGNMSRFKPRRPQGYHQISRGMKSMAASLRRKFGKQYPEASVKVDGRDGWIVVNGTKAVNISSADSRPLSMEQMYAQMEEALEFARL